MAITVIVKAIAWLRVGQETCLSSDLVSFKYSTSFINLIENSLLRKTAPWAMHISYFTYRICQIQQKFHFLNQTDLLGKQKTALAVFCFSQSFICPPINSLLNFVSNRYRRNNLIFSGRNFRNYGTTDTINRHCLLGI